MSKDLENFRAVEFVSLAQADLSADDLDVLSRYVSGGGYPLAPDAAAKLYELFLHGSTAREIQRLNKSYHLGAILDAQVRYKWTEQKDRYSFELQEKVRDKVIQAQLETTDLMSDMLVAARKQHGDKLKKFIQSGDEKDLDGALNIESLQSLMKITEGLLKITGQDRVSKVKTESTQNLNVSLNAGKSSEELTPDEAAQVLEIFAESRRRKNAGEAKGQD